MKIIIINPNSSDEMTASIQKAADRYVNGRFEAVAVSTPGAPEFIDYYEDHARALPGMIQIIKENEKTADAFLVACHCDPNMHILRQISHKPVIGIGEASMRLAPMLGARFTVLATDPHSVTHKEDIIHEYGLDHYLASVKVTNPSIINAFDAYEDAARRAMKEDHAEVLVLGCAGLCELAEELTKRLQVPVLDGVVCGLIVAEGLVNAGLTTSKVRLYANRD